MTGARFRTTRLRTTVAALLLLGLGLGLVAACGKKNDPEPPSGPTAGYGRVYPRPNTISQ